MDSERLMKLLKGTDLFVVKSKYLRGCFAVIEIEFVLIHTMYINFGELRTTGDEYRDI